MKAWKFKTLLLLLSAPLIGQAQTPVIEDATVNLAKSYISLAGSNFSPTSIAPTVTVGGTSRTVYSFTNTAIVVEVPSALAAATYLVTVTNSLPHSGSAYVTVGAVGPQGAAGATGATGPAGPAGATGPQGPAGTITLPFNGSGAGVENAVLNITDTSPAHSAIAGHGAQALAGSDTAGSGVGAYGGPSNGTDAITGFGGTGVYTVGGAGTAPSDVGGIGLNGFGGDAPGQLAIGGPGVKATGGNAAGEFGEGGDGIDATGGTGGFAGGDGIYAVAGVSNTSSLSPYAGVFNGDVDVEGALSKSSGSFKIDHPLDPANKYLYHSFVESPDMMNIYNGNVTTDGSGTAIITMPAWFEALNTDFRYQLTVIGQFAQAIVAAEISNGSFAIKTSRPGVKVSWQVTGIRQDAWANAHRIQVEVEKTPRDQVTTYIPNYSATLVNRASQKRIIPGRLRQRRNNKENFMTNNFAHFTSRLALTAAAAMALPAATFTTLQSFDVTDGANPGAGLVQVSSGYLYGTAPYGGAHSGGTVFKITPGGALTTVYSFCSLANCTDGKVPFAGLVQATNGYLYGTAVAGGANGYGTVFKITPSGTLTTLYSFCSLANCVDGEYPYASLVQATNGDLYGTTTAGGPGCSTDSRNHYGPAGGGGCSGTVFKITPGGVLTTLYNFCSLTDCADGQDPYAGLVQAANGDLYGTTLYGGANNSGAGTIFKITPTGAFTTVYSFCAVTGCPDGQVPQAGLIQATNGYLYGTTLYGGANCGPLGCGTVFKITPGGTLTTLYSFCAETGCSDGGIPAAGLVQATNGDLYGTTYQGGANCSAPGCGTLFEITPSGALTTLYTFCAQPACADGDYPTGALAQDTNGKLYGTAYFGGASGDGAVFSVSAGLGPFVKTLPTTGVVGEAVTILGSDFTGATKVTFNGVAVAFTIGSAFKISTTVPTGATTGEVQVTTPLGTFSSNVPFRVL